MPELPQTLYARLRDELRASILDGRLKPHDKLPSESEMSAAHGVSRITVRQALGDLQKEGLIVRLQGKGAFVSHPRASQSLNRLQGLGEALSVQGQTVHSKPLSMKRMKAPAAIAAQLRLAPGEDVYRLATLRYLDREPLSLNTSHFGAALGERLARIDVSARDLIEVLEHDLGVKVAQAQLDISARRAAAADARRLKIPAGDTVLQVERVLCDDTGRPVQLETAIYRAETFSYRLNLQR
ncbi:MAG: GntR family transcriptional regulator [Polaromonas sp.]